MNARADPFLSRTRKLLAFGVFGIFILTGPAHAFAHKPATPVQSGPSSWNDNDLVAEPQIGLFRFYEPNLQRWLNRDPIGEAGGINLYGYVFNDPVNRIDPLGLSGWMDMRALPNYTGPSTLTPSEIPEIPIEDVANFGGGLGDALSLNLTQLGRDAMGIDSVDTSSLGYKAGSWSSCAIGVGRLAYAGLAKAGSIFAKTPQAASAFRDALKNTFRGGVGNNWRPPNLSGKTGDALRASAGRTNPGMNIYGAGVAGTGAANAIVDDEGDQ